MTKKKKNNLGAPVKPDSKKIQGNHLRKDQQEWLEDQAVMRKVSMWNMVRLCIDTARDVFDKKYGDAREANSLFDRTLGENMDGKEVVVGKK